MHGLSKKSRESIKKETHMNHDGSFLNYSKNKSIFDLQQILLFIFILSANTLSYVEGLSKFVILYGLCFTFLYLIYIFYIKKIHILPELVIYVTWIIWCIGGSVNAVNKVAYFEGLRTVIQIAIMFFLISGLISTRFKMFEVTMIGLITSGLIQNIYIFSTGELFSALENDTRERVAGLSKNANNFAFQMLTVIFAVFYLWSKKYNYFIRFIMWFTLFVSAVGIIYSGSRNGFFCFFAFIFLWYLFCKQKKLPKHPIFAYAILIAIFIIAYLSISSLLENTLIWRRLSTLDDSSSQTRFFLYREGIELIIKNPVFGIGLNNFSEVSKTGLYSHSDYIEVAANTGIIGFILYFSIYLILWRRLERIRKSVVCPQLMYTIGVLQASILTILISGVGKPHITSKLTWIILSAVAGYTWYLEHNLLNLKKIIGFTSISINRS